MSIVKQLVELHGGSIRAESAGARQGAAFTVVLPLAAAGGERMTESGSGRSVGGTPAGYGGGDRCDGPDLGGVSVLVVDDEPDAREMVKRLLAGRGAAVETAESAEEAIEKVKGKRFDVMVSDVGMPEEDGYDLLRRVRLRRSARELPAAALTAFARPEDRKRAMLAGFQTHVAKPVDPDELVAVVATLAGRTGGP